MVAFKNEKNGYLRINMKNTWGIDGVAIGWVS